MQEPVTITVLCPNLKCRAVLNVPGETRGKKVRCGKCGTTLVVPAEPGAGGRKWY